MNKIGLSARTIGVALASLAMSTPAYAAITPSPPARLPRTEREEDSDRHLERMGRRALRPTSKAAELRNRTRGAGRL